MRVDLDGISPLKEKKYQVNLRTFRADRNDNLGGIAEFKLSSLCIGMKVFLYLKTLQKEKNNER